MFVGAAVLSALSAAAVAATLPSVPAHPAAGLRMMRQALANRTLMAGVGCVVLVAFGNFAAYPYIRLAIDDVAPHGAAWLLLVWGLGGLAGNLAAGALSSRLGLPSQERPCSSRCGLALTAVAPTLPLLVIGIVVWGFGFNMTPVATQLWVTRAEPEHFESAVAMQVTAFQAAITLGAVVGGAIVDTHQVQTTLLLGAAFRDRQRPRLRPPPHAARLRSSATPGVPSVMRGERPAERGCGAVAHGKADLLHRARLVGEQCAGVLHAQVAQHLAGGPTDLPTEPLGQRRPGEVNQPGHPLDRPRLARAFGEGRDHDGNGRIRAVGKRGAPCPSTCDHAATIAAPISPP